MDILIKSFNRPYYLERCIRSIYQHVKGGYHIKVLDDGTPPEYLQKIETLFPEVEVLRSPLYSKKVAAINNHVAGEKNFDQFSIPTVFWIEQVAKCSAQFLMLEDDIWLTSPVDISRVNTAMEKESLVIVKLSWHGNESIVSGKKSRIDGTMEAIEPSISYLKKLVLLNKFKLGSIYSRIGLMRFEFLLPFYAYYSVAPAFFNTEYWMFLWKGMEARVNETHQLRKATKWAMSERSKYGKMEKEVSKTSFITSATNTYPGVDLDIFHFNHQLNRAWLLGKLDSMTNFPKDFELEYIKTILDEAGDAKAGSAAWLKWVDRFKAQYLSIGCVVE